MGVVFQATSCWLGALIILWGPKENLELSSSPDWSILETEALSQPLLRRSLKRQHVTCPAEKGTEPCAKVDKDNGVVCF